MRHSKCASSYMTSHEVNQLKLQVLNSRYFMVSQILRNGLSEEKKHLKVILEGLRQV